MYSLALRLLCALLMSSLSLQGTLVSERKKTLPTSHLKSRLKENKDVIREQQQKKLISINDLSLYCFLEYTHHLVDELKSSMLTVKDGTCYDDNGNATQEDNVNQLLALKKISVVIEEEKRLLIKIIEALNQDQKTYLDLTYKFENLCNLLDEVEEIRPRDIRHFKNSIQKFETYVNHYAYRKLARPLTQSNSMLINDIKKFLNLIKFSIPEWENFLSIGFIDKVEDTLIYRPWEFMCKYPAIPLTMGLLVAVGIGYFYIMPKVETWMLSNQNTHLSVTQLAAIRQQGAECSVHALYNARCMMRGTNEEEIRAMVNDRTAFQQFRTECLRVNGGNIQNLDQYAVQELVANLVPENNNLTIVPGQNSLIMQEDITIHPDSGRPLEPNPANPRTAGYHSLEGLNGENMRARAARFAQGTPQYFIANTSAEVLDGGGHWIAYRFTRDQQVPGGVRILAANSTIGNITNNQIVNGINTMISGN